jgi:phosphotriesterase-related protein
MRHRCWRGEELDDREKSTQKAVELHQTGIDVPVELTTIGLGRDTRGVAAIAAHSWLHIVLAIGIHREAHYPPE